MRFHTVTFSPSIDYKIYGDKALKLHGLNRVDHYEFKPGGKGINAGITLQRLGFRVVNYVFLGKVNHLFFKNLCLQENLVIKDFLVDGITRTNVKYHSSEHHFEINGTNLLIDQASYQHFLHYFDNLNSDEDVVLIMGRINENYLTNFLQHLNKKKINFVIDIDLDNITSFLNYQPLVYKPNFDEAQRSTNLALTNLLEIKQALQLYKSWGAKIPIISAGVNGSYMLSKSNQLIRVKPKHPITIKSTVGAGDTLTSSFIAHYAMSKDEKAAFIYANACALSAVSSNWLVDVTKIPVMLDNLEVTIDN